MSFEEEFETLAEWLRRKSREYLDEPIKSGGYRDSEATWRHKEDVEEYNRRLDALKAKYGIK